MLAKLKRGFIAALKGELLFYAMVFILAGIISLVQLF